MKVPRHGIVHEVLCGATDIMETPKGDHEWSTDPSSSETEACSEQCSFQLKELTFYEYERVNINLYQIFHPAFCTALCSLQSLQISFLVYTHVVLLWIWHDDSFLREWPDSRGTIHGHGVRRRCWQKASKIGIFHCVPGGSTSPKSGPGFVMKCVGFQTCSPFRVHHIISQHGPVLSIMKQIMSAKLRVRLLLSFSEIRTFLKRWKRLWDTLERLSCNTASIWLIQGLWTSSGTWRQWATYLRELLLPKSAVPGLWCFWWTTRMSALY